MARPTFIHTLVLGGFSMVAAALLASGNLMTAEEIRQRGMEDLQASLGQVIPKSIHDNNPVADAASVAGTKVYRAMKGGKVTGVAFQSSRVGYAGPVELIMGVDAEGRLLGVRVIKHNETPGLGDKVDVAKTDWITRFDGLSLGNPPEDKWAVKKDGGQFDQFSGATITPRAVVGAIRDGLGFFATHKAELLEAK